MHRLLVSLCLLIPLIACSRPNTHASYSASDGGDSQPLFAISGTVSGLIGTGLVLRNEGLELTIRENGPFHFAATIETGTPYDVQIKAQPTMPSQTCSVKNGSGVASVDAAAIEVTCTTNLYTVGGTIDGLLGAMVLTTNGQELTVDAEGAFTFPTPLESGTAYDVQVKQPPTGQTCAVMGGQGTIVSEDEKSVVVSCTSLPFTVGGTLTGLIAGTVTLQLNEAETIDLSADASFTFQTQVAFGSHYEAKVLVQPEGQTCLVSGGNGQMPAMDIDSVAVTCTANTYTIGGSVTDLLWSSSVTLQLSPTNQVTVSSNTSFTFPTPLTFQSPYTVSVAVQADRQICTVTPATERLVPAMNVTDVVVTCHCLSGYTPIGGLCVDIDECATNHGGCSANSTCVNTSGSFSCHCNPGYSGPSCSGGYPSYDVGINHTCDVRPDGSLWCWGNNSHGELGDGTTISRSVPVPIGTDTDWATVTTADTYTCAIRTSGTLWCWGNNQSGWLGDGTSTSQNAPIQIGSATDWTSLSAGSHHACAIHADGSLWCWGGSDAGQVGTNSTGTIKVPTRVGTATDWASVAAGYRHTCGLRTNGALWCWGEASSGQLGTGTTSTTPRKTPVQVGTATDWTSVTPGYFHTCGLRTDGSLWCWGNGGAGQLGDGAQSSHSAPTQVGTATDWRSVGAGKDHTCATRADGTLWCSGTNDSGQLGDGTQVSQVAFTQLGSATDWVSVVASFARTCGLRTDGTLWCWGDNRFGQAGAGTGGRRPSPVAVGLGGVDAITGGRWHTCVVRTNGTLWCAGTNNNFQVGDGTLLSRASLVPIGTATNWSTLAAGEVHTCGVRTDGTLWCWGDNFAGQLGIGSFPNYAIPYQIGTSTDWSSVAASANATCGTRTNGTLWCWGDNTSGQLGDGTEVNRNTPVQVGTSTSWASVARGGSHTCARQTDGTLWCWGDSSNGQVGVGTQALINNLPLQVGTSTNWSSFAGGGRHTCALRTDGTLWCWGRNSDGQLGDGSTTMHTEPVQSDAATDWVAVTAGADHTCGLRMNGTLWCWGRNEFGQLGDGSLTSRSVPVQVGSATDWAAVTAGPTHTCGRRINGDLWCWGLSMDGQFGDGTAWYLLPQAVLEP